MGVSGTSATDYHQAVLVSGRHPSVLLAESFAARGEGSSGHRIANRITGHRRHGRVPTAFVLGGGGSRGAYQMGMLRALAERGIVADFVVGASVGAINAAAYASRPTVEGIYLNSDRWRDLTTDDVFPRDRLYGSWRFVEKRASVFPLSGLRKVVDGMLRFERLEQSPVPLAVVGCRVADGGEQWFTAGPASDIIVASAALPAVFPPVEVDGEHIMDGGVVNNTPLSVALEAGARRIYVLLCATVRHPFLTPERPIEALFSAFDMALAARLRRDLAAVGDRAEVVVLEPPPARRIDWQDFSRAAAMIEAGYVSARDTLSAYADEDPSSSPTPVAAAGRRKNVSR